MMISIKGAASQKLWAAILRGEVDKKTFQPNHLLLKRGASNTITVYIANCFGEVLTKCGKFDLPPNQHAKLISVSKAFELKIVVEGGIE